MINLKVIFYISLQKNLSLMSVANEMVVLQ